jgi:hypothetical protein
VYTFTIVQVYTFARQSPVPLMTESQQLIFWTAVSGLVVILIQLAACIYFYGRLVERVDNLHSTVQAMWEIMERRRSNR